jgi:hypothetical protein
MFAQGPASGRVAWRTGMMGFTLRAPTCSPPCSCSCHSLFVQGAAGTGCCCGTATHSADPAWALLQLSCRGILERGTQCHTLQTAWLLSGHADRAAARSAWRPATASALASQLMQALHGLHWYAACTRGSPAGLRMACTHGWGVHSAAAPADSPAACYNQCHN